MTVPSTLTVGNTWAWTHDVADYPASAWTGTYYIQNATKSFAVDTTPSGTSFSVNVVAASTQAYEPGTYRWVLLVASGANRYTAAQGEVEVLADPADVQALDFRTVARKRLEAVEAYLADPNNLTAASYSIGGRSLSRWSRGELLAERDKLKMEVQSEKATERMAAGLGNPRRLYVRFDRG